MNFEGKNAVFELMSSKNKTVEKIIILDKTTDEKHRQIIKMAQDAGIKLEFVSKLVLDKLSETGHHQGVVAVATDYVYHDLFDEINKARNEGKRITVVLLDGVVDPHNLGSIIRTGECCGATCVVVPKNRSALVNETVTRVSAGALAYVPVCKVTNIASTIEKLKELGIWVYACDMDGNEMYKTNLKGDCAIIVGGEGSGVSRIAREKSDSIISIPMQGKINSLNASVSASIILYEIFRQNEKG
ncbi:MAG: 23S rRNA (guanosine(2251)-2'-O)-methyltransferase RlmB [Clostridia bacterium]|nr:23S rRNA (guanosine(2251)-2'-O)-methyltransferase RlmB [Clostridia bacterium]